MDVGASTPVRALVSGQGGPLGRVEKIRKISAGVTEKGSADGSAQALSFLAEEITAG